MARVRSSSTQSCTPLRGWEMAEVAAGAALAPAELEKLLPRWQPAEVPGSVASALRSAGSCGPSHGSRLDEVDWWFRCKVLWGEAPQAARVLRFEGLATICSAFLDGEPILASDNMFLEHEIELGPRPGGESELLLCFHSVSAALKLRRPRPHWKARLFASQNLRFLRTAALGRVPLWGNTAPVSGPWRPVLQLDRRGVRVEQADVRATPQPGGRGTVEALLRVRLPDGRLPRKATLQAGSEKAALSIASHPDGQALVSGTLTLNAAALWWPHTHGAQPLYPISVELDDELLELGLTGFRRIELAREDGGFELSVNGQRLFCRGACWTTPDVLTLAGDPEPLLRRARDAGMNLIRVIGFGVYESDRFYDLCDQLGLLVWQDFMFANLDYPGDDAAFAASVRAEATQQLSRLQLAPCLALLCGSSDVQQMAAFHGVEASVACAQLFRDLLPRLSREFRPDVPYLESSASDSRVGVRVNHGPAHYFGVGAYRRPLSDVRRSGVRFASECLAFARVPEDRTIELFLPAGAGPVHHPAWKQGTPRDAAVGWDFDDVNEHYMRELVGIDPVLLRSEEPARYLELSRVLTGELSVQVIAELRSDMSRCSGVLFWTMSDVVPGPGWGLIDAVGRPKAAWYFARRAFSSRLHLTDEGLNGLRLHAINETLHSEDALLRIRFVRDGKLIVHAADHEFAIPALRTIGLDVDELVGRFIDSSHAYRFGPSQFEFVGAQLFARDTGQLIGEAAHFPGHLPMDRTADPQLSGEIHIEAAGRATLTLRSPTLALWIALEAGAWLPEDNFFHLLPSEERTVRLSAPASARPPAVVALPFNGRRPCRIAAPGVSK